MNKKRNIIPGFTLIELLVVISIIGVLAGIVLVSFTSSQKQARDIQRKSDLKQYQTALESFANSHEGLYPADENPEIVSLSDDICTDRLGIQTCPEDPKYDPVTGDPLYEYLNEDYTERGGFGYTTGYVIWAVLESGSADYWVVCSGGENGENPLEPTVDGGCPF